MAEAFHIWDVVAVPFLYTDRPVQQRRPALVIACPGTTGGPDLLWVLMITSEANRGWIGDVPVSNLSAAGLSARSVVRCAKIATIEATDAKRKGILPEADRTAVRECIHSLLHLSTAAPD